MAGSRFEVFDPNTLQQTSLIYAEEFRQRILSLGHTPAIFPNTIAKLYAQISQLLAYQVNIEDLAELCSLLPDIKQQYYDQLPLVPVCDLFDQSQLEAIIAASQLETDSPLFQPLTAQVDRLLRICGEQRDKNLIELLNTLAL